MAKNTQNIGDNSSNDPVAKFKSAGLAEIDFKGKGEAKASLALAYAILACDGVSVLSEWRGMLADYNNADEKIKERARAVFAEYIGASAFIDTSGDKERKTQDYRNLMLRQYSRMQFAVDVIALNYRDHIIIHESGKTLTAMVKGNSQLASDIWQDKDWTNRKVISDKRNPLMDIIVAQRTSATLQGEVSWSYLADLVARKSNRKGTQVRKVPLVVSADKPIGALKAVSAIMSNTDMPVHFSAVESRMQALQTGEDVLAFALEGDDDEMTAIRKGVHVELEKLRAYLQQRINAKAKLMTSASVAA